MLVKKIMQRNSADKNRSESYSDSQKDSQIALPVKEPSKNTAGKKTVKEHCW